MDLLKTRRLLDGGKTVFDLPLAVVYYARVSTDRDEQLNSLENQINYYTNFIKSNENWTYYGGYVDEGISGTSVDKRDNFLKMIRDASQNSFDLIITKEISRFSRSTLDSIKYTQELLDYGVGVFFQSDNINTLYSDSELRLTIMSSLAQDEMRRLSERVKFGMQRAYENGKVLGRDNIYGYDKVDCKLVINEKEAEFVRDLFNIYADGRYGYRTIARILTEKGYKSQAAKEINPSTLKGIISNPKYKGFYRGRLTESKDYRSKKNIKIAQEEQILYKDENIPAIVSEELWDKANEVLSRRSKIYHNVGNGTQNRFPYSGKIICGEHNTYHYRKVWKDRKTPTESWCCREYLAKGRRACSTPHLYTKGLDAILEYIGKGLLCSKEKYVQSVDSLIGLYKRAERRNTDYSLEISKVIKDIEKTKFKQDKVLELYTDGDMEKNSYLDMHNRLKSSVEQLNTKLNDLKQEQAKSATVADTLVKVQEFFDTLTKNYENALDVARNMLDNVVILTGSTQKEIKIKITMKYRESIHCTISRSFILYGETEVSPIVGTEKESAELVEYLTKEFETDPNKIWESNIFGKSLHDMVTDGLQNKLYRMPEDAQMKLQETLQKIINEGSGGLICIIL